MLLNHYYADFYKLTGRPPWTGIADHPSQYIAKKSRPDSDTSFKNHLTWSQWCWCLLKHWLKLQKRNKRPLILKMAPMGPSETTSSSKHKGKQPRLSWPMMTNLMRETFRRTWRIDLMRGTRMINPTILTMGMIRKSSTTNPSQRIGSVEGRREFLATLSKDKNYQKLLLLIRAANAVIVINCHYTI